MEAFNGGSTHASNMKANVAVYMVASKFKMH